MVYLIPNSNALASLFKAVAEPLRLMILRVLLNNSFGVLELTQLFATTQSGMSHHLKVLLQANLVTTRREGNTIFYRRTLPIEQQKVQLYQALLDEIDSLEIPEDLQQKIATIYDLRAELSRAFFANLALKRNFEQQDVIACVTQYQEVILKLVDSVGFSDTATAMEIGPGEGVFLPQLARRFKTVIAVDNSIEMLELAKHYCTEKALTNIDFKRLDATSLTIDEPIDCMVINMVLHHLPSPAEALKVFARCLKSTGSLFLTELCHHEQMWVRETCGDLWLGFEPDELNHWAKTAGLQPDESIYVGLRNGFQLQIRRFRIS